MAAIPRKPMAQGERVSPGVYRNGQGALTRGSTNDTPPPRQFNAGNPGRPSQAPQQQAPQNGHWNNGHWMPNRTDGHWNNGHWMPNRTDGHWNNGHWMENQTAPSLPGTNGGPLEPINPVAHIPGTLPGIINPGSQYSQFPVAHWPGGTTGHDSGNLQSILNGMANGAVNDMGSQAFQHMIQYNQQHPQGGQGAYNGGSPQASGGMYNGGNPPSSGGNLNNSNWGKLIAQAMGQAGNLPMRKGTLY